MTNPIKAFTYQLGTQEIVEPNVVQHNAGWVIAVIPLMLPDTFGITLGQNVSGPESVQTRKTILITSDCVSVKTNQTKASPFGSLETVLKSGNINYLGAVFPGDFIFAWIHSNRSALDKVIESISKGEPANHFDSGLKFMGRVESVREHLRMSAPGIGTKELFYTISATSFQEFNTKVYITPFHMAKNSYEFMALLNPQFASLQGAGLGVPVQKVVLSFLRIFMGKGPKSLQLAPGMSPNEAFLIPNSVGALLKRTDREKGALRVTDILTVIMGVQDYSSSEFISAQSPTGFMPWIASGGSSLSFEGGPPELVNTRQCETPIPCSGRNITFGEMWSDVPVWSILQQYGNLHINELFTCLRVDADARIVPTLIMREIPFTTQEYLDRREWADGGALNSKIKEARNVTLFMSLPRWKVDPAMVIEQDVGRGNSLRVNFVQVWGEFAAGAAPKSAPTPDGGAEDTGRKESILTSTTLQKAMQFSSSNRIGDIPDIKRSGLRPYVLTIPHDYPGDGGVATHSPVWARKISDWIINGHLKLNGNVVVTGISEPICIGDNFEWNGVVFHIEQVTHTAQISPQGLVSFRTTLSLSNGLDVRSDSITRYPQMDVMYREDLAAKDQERDKIYPGYTDVQSDPDRDNAEVPNPRTSPDFGREE